MSSFETAEPVAGFGSSISTTPLPTPGIGNTLTSAPASGTLAVLLNGVTVEYITLPSLAAALGVSSVFGGSGLAAVTSGNTVTTFDSTGLLPMIVDGAQVYISPANMIAELGSRSSDSGVPGASALTGTNSFFLEQGGSSAAAATLTQLNSFVGAPPVITIGASGSGQTLTFPSSGNVCYDITLNGNCTLTLAGGTAGLLQSITVIVRQNSNAGHVLTLPTGVKWPNGTAPIPNTLAGVIDVFTLLTSDAQTTVIGKY